MKIIVTKRAVGAKSDQLQLIRDDGSVSEIDMPRQGILPHDLLHFVVESGFALPGGFLSIVANGIEPGFAMVQSHAPSMTHKRQAGIAEAMVEAMQTQLWSGQFDHAAFEYALQMATEARSIAVPECPAEMQCRGVFQQALELTQAWLNLSEAQYLEFDFHLHGTTAESEQ
ncbi:hypothetical protein ACO0K7_18435 [Undibacterium sp. Ji67W]|uniref:hypothetical protein n=1 Tax=Undibacterium sp. Ji67W TaxID=3413042 RepID=UPI003BF059AD